MDNFKLLKIKLTKSLGVEATYNEKIVREDATYWLEKTVKSTIHRHPDLDNTLEKFSPHVARIFGVLAVGMYKPEEDFNKQEKELFNEVISSLSIESVTISYDGSDEKQGCVVTATRSVLDNKTVVMNTPLMRFDDEQYSYCYELGTIIEEVIQETFQYIFKRKYAQLDLFSEEQQTEKSSAK